MKYELIDEPGKFLEISTTRPETLMGDIAVAVHPEDDRYKSLVGKKVRRPFPEAEIEIIADEHVDIEFGTGCLKITPAHDKADFEIGQRHDLEIIDVLHPDGTVNCPEVPEVEEYDNNVGFSERADVVVEPRISMQWFLKYPCVEQSKEAVAQGDIKFRPARWAKTYDHWLNNIQDWCISRQLWWGHQIPVWYKKEKAFALKEAETLDISHLKSGDIYVGKEPPADPENWERDEDVMDTWFSSWLWPFATMNEKELDKFYPTADLVTGPDIIFFWVARMIMAGYRFKEEFALMRTAPVDSDIRFLDETCPKTGETIYPQVEEGRNFANKLYNAARFRQMQGSETEQLGDQLDEKLEKAYSEYRFNDLCAALYEFFWTEYCDKFLEAVKGDFRGNDSERKQQTLATIDTVLERFLTALHPLMPHITEELSTRLGFTTEGNFLMLQEIKPNKVLSSLSVDQISQAENIANAAYETASRLRNLKAEYNLAASKDVNFIVKPTAEWVSDQLSTLTVLVGAKSFSVEADYAAPKGTPAAVTSIGEVYMPLDGLIDVDAEKKRLSGQIEKIDKEIAKVNGKLNNEQFVSRAPAALVDKERTALAEIEAKKAQLEEMLAALG